MRVAVLPARGGSRRIPRKNVRSFAGLPIIVWSIKTALRSGLFDLVLVSTDDSEIAAIARDAGAETPFLRPADLADDHTGTGVVVRHALSWLAGQGQHFELACCIYATAPFLQVRYLRAGLEALQASGKSYAFSVTSFPAPIQRALRVRSDGALEAFWPKNVPKRSQDLEPAYHDAAQFYWGRARAFLDDVPLFSDEAVPVHLPRYLVQDIDTVEDWRQAELMFESLRRREELEC